MSWLLILVWGSEPLADAECDHSEHLSNMALEGRSEGQTSSYKETISSPRPRTNWIFQTGVLL